MDILAWTGTSTLAIASAWIVVLNWSAVVAGWRGGKHRSWIPILGGSLGCAALMSVPDPGPRALWWIPFLVDYGCVPGLLGTASVLLWRRMRRGPRDGAP